MTRVIAVFGSSQTRPSDPAYHEAERLGYLLGEAGYSVATGGYRGTMEAVSAGAARTGRPVIGVTAPTVFPDRSGANRYVTDERTAITISQRIHNLVDMADAHVALPGSLGTVTELMVAWNDGYLAPVAGKAPKPLIAVGDVWDPLVDLMASSYAADTTPVTRVRTIEHVVPILRDRFGLAPGPTGG